MADDKAVGAPALDTNIESGNFDEKRAQPPTEAVPPKKDAPAEEEEEDEDIDALIEDLESEDGHAFEEEEEETNPATGRIVPEDMLQTDSRLGLTESEVVARRRKYGLNQMKEEKENLVLKFLGFFIGPIQFVMEVSFFLSIFSLFPPFFASRSAHDCLGFDTHGHDSSRQRSHQHHHTLLQLISKPRSPDAASDSLQLPCFLFSRAWLLGSRLAAPHQLHTGSALIGSIGLAELICTPFPCARENYACGGPKNADPLNTLTCHPLHSYPNRRRRSPIRKKHPYLLRVLRIRHLLTIVS